MKWLTAWCLSLLLCAAPRPAPGQETDPEQAPSHPPGAPPSHPRRGELPPPGRGDAEEPARDHHPPPRRHHRRPLERWMHRLQQRDPEEFERLRRLQAEDPEAFYHEMERRVRRHRVRSRLEAAPRLHDFLMNLPPKERTAVLDNLAQPARIPKWWANGDAEVARLEEMAWELAGAYRSATDEAKREEVQSELRHTLNRLFELREEQRRAVVQRLEEKLDRLKASLAKREADREQIIERRLQELTESDPLAW